MKVNDLFYTIQGEGYWAGRAAVFVRLSGCNLWSGEERDRASALCTFCDTEFTNYVELAEDVILGQMEAEWDALNEDKMVVFTGGEPTLQLRGAFLKQCQYQGWYTAIETNGTKDLPVGLDWVCVSPKTKTLRVKEGNELKFVYPQDHIDPEMFSHLKFDHFWVSPKNVPGTSGELDAGNIAKAVEYVLGHPKWRLNTQTHKVIGVR